MDIERIQRPPRRERGPTPPAMLGVRHRAPFPPEEAAPPLRRACAACDQTCVYPTPFGALRCAACDHIEDLSPVWEQRFSRHGGLLKRWGRSSGEDPSTVEMGEEDAAFDAQHEYATRRIVEIYAILDAFNDRLAAEGRRPSPLEAYACLELRNCARRLGGNRDGVDEIVRPKRTRTTPLGGYRHAMDVAFGIDFTPALGTTLGGYNENPYTGSIPRGICLGEEVSLHPTRNEASSAQGEDALLTRLAVAEALASVRLGVKLGPDGEVLDPGQPLTETDLELIKLLDVGRPAFRERGKLRGKAWLAKNGSLVPAYDVVPPEEVPALLQGWPDAPTTEHQVRLRAKEIRRRIRHALLDHGLIEDGPVKPRPAPRPPAYDPFALPGDPT